MSACKSHKAGTQITLHAQRLRCVALISPIANAITGNHLDRYFFNLRSLSFKILDSFFLLKVP